MIRVTGALTTHTVDGGCIGHMVHIRHIIGTIENGTVDRQSKPPEALKFREAFISFVFVFFCFDPVS